jgi:hypothetical protein
MLARFVIILFNRKHNVESMRFRQERLKFGKLSNQKQKRHSMMENKMQNTVYFKMFTRKKRNF